MLQRATISFFEEFVFHMNQLHANDSQTESSLIGPDNKESMTVLYYH